MTFSTITALPPTPSRFVTPAEFEEQVDTYLSGQQTLVSEINTLVGEMNNSLSPAVYVLSGTQSNSTLTLADITGFSHTLVANKVYRITASVTFQSAATTTGIELGFVAPSGSNPRLRITIPIVSTDASSSVSKAFPVAALSTSGTVKSTGVTATSSNHTAIVEGIVHAGSTGGTFKLQFASEVDTSAITLQIGSTLVVEALP